MFKNHLPEEVPGRRAASWCATTRGTTCGLSGRSSWNRRAQRGRRPAQGGVRARAAEPRRGPAGLLRRRRAGQGHGRRRRPGLDLLPVVPRLRRPGLFASDDPDLSLALVRAYNDWHIDEWCGAYPARFIPMAVPVIWDAGADRRRGPAGRGKGLPLAELHREPGRAGLPELPRRVLGPGVARRAATPTPCSTIHLGSSGRLAIPAVDSPPDVMITLQPMNIQSAAADLLWSRVIKNYPGPPGRRCPRAAPGGSPTSWRGSTGPSRCTRAWTLQDFGGRLPQRGVPRALPDLFHQRPGGHPAAATRSASTTSPGRPTTRTATPCGPTRPRSCGPCSRQQRPATTRSAR